MKLGKNLRLRTRLLIMVLIPLIAVLYLAIDGAIDRVRDAREMADISRLVEFSTRVSAVVHETQKERGLTAGYLGSNGETFGDQLAQQRDLTDGRAAALRSFMETFDAEDFGTRFAGGIRDALSLLEGIETVRSDVASLGISTSKAIEYYTKMNARFLEQVSLMGRLSGNAEIATHALAYANFLLGKERAGIERAVLNNTFSADTFAEGLFVRFRELVTEQKTYFQSFQVLADEEERKLLNERMAGSAVTEVERMRELANLHDAKNSLRSELATLIGYGGMIDQFKNYVLRGDQRYAKRAEQQYERAIALLDEYASLSGISSAALGDVKTVRSTLSAYRSGLDRAIALRSRNAGPVAIDRAIPVNEQAAVAAVNNLLTTDAFGVDPEYWFEQATQRINLLKEVENRVAEGISSDAARLSADARTGLILFGVLAAVLILVTISLSIGMVRAITGQVGGEPAQVMELVQEVADGNLAVNFGSNGSSEAGIRGSVKQMVGSLNELLSQVNQSVEQVSSGSNQVAQASQSLSQGATEQASSLEEISASLNQINGQASQNSDSASEANALAKTALENAQAGNERMESLVSAMDRINSNSEEITKVVKVIDNIAFQINLLALNANVEAARAGKYGKGFAVVAEEVRNLAVRSADAAKETSTMVETTTKSISEGNEAAAATSTQLDQIVEGATKVADFLEEIAQASKEQAQGVEQVNQGISQIDSVTQSNTASAEESAAAAEELSGQAEQLRKLVARFRLASDSAALHAAKTPAPSSAANNDEQSSTAPAAPSGKTGIERSEKAGATATGVTVDRSKPENVINLDDDDFGEF